MKHRLLFQTFTAFALVVATGCGSQSASTTPSGDAVDAGSPPSPAAPNVSIDAGAEGGPGVRSGGPLPIGLYSWNEIEAVEAQVKDVGESIHRLGGPLSDTEWASILRLGVKAVYTTDPTTDLTEGLKRIDAVLNRYGPGGTYWKDNPTARNQPLEAIEILNEPNYLGIAPDAYASFLVGAYAHIKATWPSVIVVGMSCGNNYASAVPWLQQVFTANPAVVTSMDALSIHIYTDNTAPDQDLSAQYFNKTLPDHLATLRSIMAAAGMRADMPLWVTEVGYRIDSTEGGLYAGFPKSVTLAQQAAYNIRFDILALRQNVDRVYHMFVVDVDHYNGGYFKNGDRAPRPVATATRQLLSLLDGYKTLEVISEDYGGGNPFVYRFEAAGRTVVVAWAQTPQTVPIAIRGTTTVTDMLGNVIANTADTSYSAALSEAPIFLTSK